VILLKSTRELQHMRAAGAILAEAKELLRQVVRAGATTEEIDRDVEALIRARGAQPAFKGYRGYPATVCTSINHEVVHGIPSPTRRLREGDIIGLDLGCIVEGYYADCAITLPVGEVPARVRELLDATRESLDKAIVQCRPGNRVGDISHAIQTHCEGHGFAVIRAFVGHGIGRQLHEDPQVPNFGEPGRGPALKAGMVLAIEPMVTMGSSDVRILGDRWTAVTEDGSLAAHFEDTVAITETGPDVLTRLGAPGEALAPGDGR
jgi:methionyl aminopeptidase